LMNDEQFLADIMKEQPTGDESGDLEHSEKSEQESNNLYD